MALFDRPLTVLNLMTTGCCFMCGLPIREHPQHLYTDNSKPFTGTTGTTFNYRSPTHIQSTPLVESQYLIWKKSWEDALSTPAQCEVSFDLQLWLNTLSRCPGKVLNYNEPVKTIALLSSAIYTNDVERDHKQASLENSVLALKESLAKKESKKDISPFRLKNPSNLSTRHSALKERLNILTRRLFRYKSTKLVKHVLEELEKFDQHAILCQLDIHHQLPCQHKYEENAPSRTCRDSNSSMMDGHAFSSYEKFRVTVGEATLRTTSTQLSTFDDNVTDSSSGEDGEDGEEYECQTSDLTIGCLNDLATVQQSWEHARAQIAAQWTWIRGQYEDLQHRMRRESDLLTVIREKKEKVVLLPSDQYMKDHIPDKFAHFPAMVPPLNGYHNHPLMKNKFDIHRVGQEMYLKSNQHKRINKASKIDGNTCARTRPIACILRRNVFTAKSITCSIAPHDVTLKSGVLGKQSQRKARMYGNDDEKHDASFHSVLSRRSETHVDFLLNPPLSGVDYFPKERKLLGLPAEDSCKDTLPVCVDLEESDGTIPTSLLNDVILTDTLINHKSPISPLPVVNSSVPFIDAIVSSQRKRGLPGATVEHMIKKYRTSLSQPGSRATSPTLCADKRKKHDQYNIHNIEVDLSVVAPARIERPQYKEIEIPKYRSVTDSVLREFLTAESQYDRTAEDDSLAAYLALHSRCEQLEKLRFINMQLNASAATRAYEESPIESDLLLTVTEGGVSPPDSPTQSLIHRQKLTFVDRKRTEPQVDLSSPEGHGTSENRNSQVSFVEEEIRRTRANKHTSEYPTAVS